MDLNLGNSLFTNSKTNTFKNKQAHSYDIAQIFAKKIKSHITLNTQNIVQSFHPCCGVIKNKQLYLGDKGGYVIEVTESMTC